MTETIARPQHAPADMPAAPLRCPFGRHYSFATGQYSVGLGYEDLTRVMERILDVWDHLEEAGVMDDQARDMFESLLGHLSTTREWTGWGGVPGRYLA